MLSGARHLDGFEVEPVPLKLAEGLASVDGQVSLFIR